ncbi:MAG: alpha/beta fold hydrolase [Cyclobacteriaceae bacterium]|jgi:pimeloyl-ACP methyl ester carboxylesterase|nr:alpha/beta hydrolase [Flammeovirgaceae bacterium]
MIRKLLKYIAYSLLGLLSLVIVVSVAWYQNDVDVSELVPTYFTAESSYIQIGDAKLHVRQRGSGPSIFLLHGSFASLHTWNGWENELEKSFRTVSVDFPGHGLTGPTASAKYSTDDYAQLIFQLADQLKIDTFYVAGNSMGGQVAWKMALQKPNRVKKLVLVDAAGYSKGANPTGSTQQNRPFVFKLLQNDVAAKFLVKITPRFLFRWNLKQVYGNPDAVREDDVTRFYDLMMRAGNREVTIQRLRQPGKNLQDSIRFITTPTLILWGEKDRWIPVANAYHFKKDIQPSRLIVWEGLGHVPMQEQPELTVAPVISFLHDKPGNNRQQ